MANKGDMFVANETFSVPLEGSMVVIHKGRTRVRAGHPLLKLAPDYFDAVDDKAHFEVEQATAEPGEKRGAPATVVAAITQRSEKKD